MPNHCCVPRCRANYRNEPKVKVFSFPKDAGLFTKWIYAIKRENFTPSKHTKICIKHFKPEDIVVSPLHGPIFNASKSSAVKYYSLKPDAVPSVFEEETRYDKESVKVSKEKIKTKSSIKTSCRSNFSKPYVSVFSFPKDPARRRQWLSSIGRPTLEVNDNIGVCIKHFEKHLISGTESHRKKLSLKHGSVPSIFEDVCSSNEDDDSKIEESVETPPKYSRMHKSAKSPLSSSTSDSNILKTPSKENGGRKSPIKSSKKALATTDRPIIAVVKAHEGLKTTPENIDEENDCIIEEPNFNSNSFSLPSRYKNLPNVSVCLKEEDKISYTRELKGIKRSSSTGSNSSIGSSEVQKAGAITKRRKIEKPAPVVIGRENDCYCWVCHRENIVLCCIACPRAYHSRCAGEISTVSPDWVCPECQKVLAAETVDTRSSTLAEISLDKLGALLKLSLNKLKSRAPLAFHQPVSLEHYPMYLHYVIHPMDLSLLEKNIKQKLYGCTEAFLADVKWIAHNSCVFNGPQHPLSTNAKNLVKSCDQDMQEIEICPDCFVHSIVRAKYWFSEVCRKPHPLVWAKLKGFPYWPAKVVRIQDGNIDARFFGAHDRAWVPISQCFHLSKEMPTTSKPKKKGNYEVALEELNIHVHLLMQKFKCFDYAPCRTYFNPEYKYLMYHGIDIDKVCKEDITFDTASASNMRFPSPEKENRFAKFMETESEKMCVDEGKLNKSQPETNKAKNLTSIEENSFTHLFKEKPVVSTSIVKETQSPESTIKKSPSEEIKMDCVEKKHENVGIPLHKKSEAISDSDQLRKLELALERIKGIVSVNVDSDKESDEKGVEDDEKDIKEIEEKTLNDKETISRDAEDAVKEKAKQLSSSIKENLTLPVPEKNDDVECNKNISTTLETTKKTDSFFLKLNETIESCKAKLGISEIADDIPDDDSVADENASGSDEDEDEDTSASEADEENSSSSDEIEDVEEENAEDNEGAELSDEEISNRVENGVNKGENSSEGEGSDGSDYESEEESNSESITSGTDIEAGNTKKGIPEKAVESNIDEEESVQEISESNHIVSASEDVQIFEVNVNGSFSQEECENVSTNEKENVSENDKNISSLSESNKNCDKALNLINTTPSKMDHETSEKQNNFDCKSATNSNSNQAFDSKDGTECSISTICLNTADEPVSHDALSPTKEVASTFQKESIQDCNTDKDHDAVIDQTISHDLSINEIKQAPHSKDEQDDDEVIICNSPKASPPPVIVIDDDQENDESSVIDKYTIKSSSTNDVISTRRNDYDRSPSRKCATLNGNATNGSLSNENRMQTRSSKNGIISKKRFATSDDSDDDIQIVTPSKKTKKLTGAIRTFNKPENNNLNPISPTNETQDGSSSKENCSPSSFNTPIYSPDKNDFRDFAISSPRSFMQNSVDTSHLSDKDKEIVFLKSKLSCVLRAYHIQGWKCSQEREELRHNMNLIIMEMRACLEADKKQAIEALSQIFEQEKLKCVEETKKKQWCAFCFMESRYACCWNTSYCSISCQKRHFPEHRNICTQLRSKNNSESVDGKPKAVAVGTSEGSENKNNKVIIVNMKQCDAAKVVASATELSSSKSPPSTSNPFQVVTSKPPIQFLTSKTLPPSSTSNSIQFYIAPMKTSTVSSSAPMISTEYIKQISINSSTENPKLNTSLPLSLPMILTASTTTTTISKTSVVTATSSVLTTKSSTLAISLLASTQPQMKSISTVGTTVQPSALTSPAAVADTSASSSKVELNEEKNLDASPIIQTVQNRNCDLDTAINLLKKENLESLPPVKNIKEENQLNKQDSNQKKEETNLEEIYFPSPPTVTFEGYDSVSPEPNLGIEEFEGFKYNYDVEISEKFDDITPEQDVVLSDDGTVNNELVSIGRGIEIKAKFLNKCLVYGHTPKKLTRCLVDVIFPDIKLLATCSAFGQKSNVTKLTRAALPARKVYSIIDFVCKRFPNATRSEIVLAINMKCKEARVILNRINTEAKTSERKSWTKDQDVSAMISPTTTTPSTTFPVTSKTVPNLVCVKSSHQTTKIPTLNLPQLPPGSLNKIQARPHILIRPKPNLKPVGSPVTLVSSPTTTLLPKKEKKTVKELLQDRLQVSASATTPTNTRPLIILGSAVNPVKQTVPTQNQSIHISPKAKK